MLSQLSRIRQNEFSFSLSHELNFFFYSSKHWTKYKKTIHHSKLIHLSLFQIFFVVLVGFEVFLVLFYFYVHHMHGLKVWILLQNLNENLLWIENLIHDERWIEGIKWLKDFQKKKISTEFHFTLISAMKFGDKNRAFIVIEILSTFDYQRESFSHLLFFSVPISRKSFLFFFQFSERTLYF